MLKKEAGGKVTILKIIQDALLRIGDTAAEPFIKALVDPNSRQDALAMFIDRKRAHQRIKARGKLYVID